MKYIVLDEVKKEKRDLKELLIKICLDFNISDYEEIVGDYLNKIDKTSKN